MVHGKAMSFLSLGTLAARPPPHPLQLAAKESTMEEPRPKEKWSVAQRNFCNNFWYIISESLYKLSPIYHMLRILREGWRAGYMSCV